MGFNSGLKGLRAVYSCHAGPARWSDAAQKTEGNSSKKKTRKKVFSYNGNYT
jgi:hypothetical protein